MVQTREVDTGSSVTLTCGPTVGDPVPEIRWFITTLEEDHLEILYNTDRVCS